MPVLNRRAPRAPGSLAARSVALATALAAPAAAAAQTTIAVASPAAPDSVAPAARSHEVRRGETLWDLAGQFLGDPFRWPAIHAANAATVANPHWIYPGQKLRIPELPAAQPAPGSAAPAPAGSSAPSDMTTVFSPSEPLYRASLPAPGPVPARVAQDTAPRSAAGLAAPFVAGPEAFRDAGRIVDGVDIPPAQLRSSRPRFQLMDHLVLRLPAGARTDSGAAYVVAAPGPTIGANQVVVPLGVAVLDGGGTAALRTARLIRVFGLVEPGQPVLPLAADAAAAPGAAAGPTRVLWVRGSAALPTLQSYVLLGRGARDGVRAGDRFELVGDGRRTPEGESLPMVRVGIARVVRVTDDAATAIVVHHDQPAIAPGLEARPLPR